MQSILQCTLSAALISFCLAPPAVAGEDDISPKILSVLKKPLTVVLVAVDSTPLYPIPDATSAPAKSVSWMGLLTVDERWMSKAPHGWIPIKEVGKRRSKPYGWVRRRDVVIPGDYKKVTGCWPVKFVAYVGGDYAAEVTFKTDGSAWVKEWGDEDWVNKEPPRKAQVYMARNIVAIEAVGGPVYFTSGYRPVERKIYPYGAPADEQELFPAEVMKGCPDEPLLDR